MKALIFHGTLGSPEGNWFPWLQEQLMLDGWQAAVPKLPTPEGQSLSNWEKALEDQIPGFAEADVLIGHSTGALFTLRLLEKNMIKPSKVILVGTVIDNINNEEYDTLNASFIETPFDWQAIKESCANIQIFHGSDDPYVPLEQPERVAKELNVPLHLIDKGGHINVESGYATFPEILKILDE